MLYLDEFIDYLILAREQLGNREITIHGFSIDDKSDSIVPRDNNRLDIVSKELFIKNLNSDTMGTIYNDK